MLRNKTAWVTKSSDAWYYIMISNNTNIILITVQNVLMLRDKTAWIMKSSDVWYYVMISNDINTILMTVQSVLMLKNKTAWVMKSSNIWYYVMISIDTNIILVTISTETRDKHISSQSYWDLCMKWNKKQWLTDQLKSDDELDFEIIEVEQFKHKIL